MDDADFGKEGGVYSGAGTVEEKLERARTELLDLSARNRLLNMPKAAKSAKIIELVDERTQDFLANIPEMFADAFEDGPDMIARQAFYSPVGSGGCAFATALFQSTPEMLRRNLVPMSVRRRSGASRRRTSFSMLNVSLACGSRKTKRRIESGPDWRIGDGN
ncbi:DUF4011 domain-containing protein [Paracoccus fontiphilus]|uniref:DUF4011 domain-containing protein n=1 Tax=Paracoccus fontiphilus TaxID=1815556 RepID=A0ABV7I8L8_9RHOB|nr:DUF4011 domain-containing protein [Paracoccus fontiphilus]